MNKDLEQKILFITELEKLKLVLRTNKTIDKKRAENSAEHSWHIALMALIFKDNFIYRNYDLFKVIKMLLIHDVVEIDAGDTNLYRRNVEETRSKEDQAAKRIFGLLPKEFCDEFYQLWIEFDERKTDESMIANAIDNLQPLINHPLSRDENERVLDIKYSEIVNKKKFIKNISEDLWEVAKRYIEYGIQKGLYIDDRDKS